MKNAFSYLADKAVGTGKAAIDAIRAKVANLRIPRPKFDTDWLGDTSSENASHTEYCGIYCSECAYSEVPSLALLDGDSDEEEEKCTEQQVALMDESRYMVQVNEDQTV